LQLSRITNRKGLQENIPQLAGAEFGWSLDERRLFIGNGTIPDGAPIIGNTEILTEFSDILALSSTYTYKGLAAGYQVTTGPGSEAIVRTLQSKFDDMASVKDFGAVGDGVTDDTDAINRALFELFCREVNIEIRRSLFFPAGIYKVSGSIKIPPHAKLYGEGLTSSIIKYVSTAAISITALVPGTRYAITAVGTSDFALIGASANTVDEIFIATAAGVGTGTARPVTEYVVETADSLQQTGIAIGSNFASSPTGIEMISMAIYSEEKNTLLKLDSVTNSGFHYIGLHGPNNLDPKDPTGTTKAIELVSSVSNVKDITITKLDTEYTSFAIQAFGNIKGVIIEDCGFDLHYQGVSLINPTVDVINLVDGVEYKIVSVSTTDFTLIGASNNNVGTVFIADGTNPFIGGGTVIDLSVPSPTGIVIARNIFDKIAHSGIHFHNVLFNSSSHNVFYNVGNNLGSSPIAPVIEMVTDKCISLGDLFEREDESIQPRIALNGNGGIAMDSTHSIHLGSYERQVGLEASLLSSTVNGSIFLFADPSPNSFKFDYAITRGSETRIGSMHVANNGSGITFNEEFTQNNDLGVDLDVVASGTNSEIQFTSTAGTDAVINYSIVRLD